VNNRYHFVSRWRVDGTCGEVADILGDPLALPRWWPSVYLAADELAPAGADGLGQRVALRTQGWLPYTLTWGLEVVESNYPHGFTLVAAGDLDGVGVWTFEQDGSSVEITYDWRVRAEKPLLKNLSDWLWPAFEANHRWAMEQGETSLRSELARRRATSDDARAGVPLPPGPVTYAGAALVGGAIGVSVTLLFLLSRARRRR